MAFSNIHGFRSLASKNLQDSYLMVRLYNGRMDQAPERGREAMGAANAPGSKK
jgi:hypothetical protein